MQCIHHSSSWILRGQWLRVGLIVLAVPLVGASCTKSTTFPMDGGTEAHDSAPDPVDAHLIDGGRPLLPGVVGDPCGDDSACESGLCVRESIFPDGECSMWCSSSAECPGDSVCQHLLGLCMPTCAADTSGGCRPGRSCAATASVEGGPGCVVGCYEDADCRDGRECDGFGSSDWPGSCFVPEASVGGACEVSSDCAAGVFCRPEYGAGWPGGACTWSFSCETGVRPSETSSACLPGCEDSSDCRDGYRCAVVPSGDRACVPGCETDFGCDELECVASLGTCLGPFVSEEVGETCDVADPESCRGGWCMPITDDVDQQICLVAGCRLAGTGPSRDCPSDTRCVAPPEEMRTNRPELSDREIGLCMPTCSTASACPTGTECRAGACRW